MYGQMNEPPGARARVCLTGLTVAEYFRDKEGQDVLLFIDNIFRFTQAGSEVSALLGRIPSAVGYQPTLATDMGSMQERITTTKKVFFFCRMYKPHSSFLGSIKRGSSFAMRIPLKDRFISPYTRRKSLIWNCCSAQC